MCTPGAGARGQGDFSATFITIYRRNVAGLGFLTPLSAYRTPDQKRRKRTSHRAHEMFTFPDSALPVLLARLT